MVYDEKGNSSHHDHRSKCVPLVEFSEKFKLHYSRSREPAKLCSLPTHRYTYWGRMIGITEVKHSIPQLIPRTDQLAPNHYCMLDRGNTIHPCFVFLENAMYGETRSLYTPPPGSSSSPSSSLLVHGKKQFREGHEFWLDDVVCILIKYWIWCRWNIWQ